MIGQMRRCRHHAPGVARRAHAAPLAGEGDQEVVPALCATGAGEAMGEDDALELTAELALNVAGNRVGVIEFATSQRKPSLWTVR